MEKKLGWEEQRRIWNSEGQCAREACRGDITEVKYYNTGSRLYYCQTCARLIDRPPRLLDYPLCWEVRPEGRYKTPDGVEGELGEYDEFACRYTFKPDGTKPPAIIGPGVPYPYLHFGLEEALKLVALEV